MKWQPIETAPLWRDVLVGVYVGSRWSAWVAHFDDGWGCDGANGDEPTHWTEIVEPICVE